MNNLYISVKELQALLKISYRSSNEIITEVQKEMKEKGYLIPHTRSKLALTWMVKKKMGIKDD